MADDNPEESSVRHVSEDVKRVLGALKTSEAAAALEAGGGGKRAEALRALAEAKAAAGAYRSCTDCIFCMLNLAGFWVAASGRKRCGHWQRQRPLQVCQLYC